MSALLAHTHLVLAMLTLAGPLVALWLLSRRLNAGRAAWLCRVDQLNALAATLVLAVGVVRLLHFGKGLDHYLHNPPFLAKLALYLVASGLSLVCTLELRRWGPLLRMGQTPQLAAPQLRRMRRALVGQAACVLGMALCAALAARGIGSG